MVALIGRRGGARGDVFSDARLLAPSPCGAGGMAPPLPLRRGGQAPCVPMASVRQWPHRRVCWSCCACIQSTVNVTCASTRSEHGIPGPRRRQPRSPAALLPITPGCRPDERLSSRPRGAGWNEAVRGTGVPRAAKGAVELQTRTAKGAVKRLPKNDDRRSWHPFHAVARRRRSTTARHSPSKDGGISTRIFAQPRASAERSAS